MFVDYLGWGWNWWLQVVSGQFAILTTLSETSQAQVMNDVFLLTGWACGGGSYGLPNSKKPSVC